jgi:hypothetical protein
MCGFDQFSVGAVCPLGGWPPTIHPSVGQRDSDFGFFSFHKWETKRGNSQESELKFLFAPEDLPKVKAVPLLKDALPHADRQRLTASYFDTPDKYLAERASERRAVPISEVGGGLICALQKF